MATLFNWLSNKAFYVHVWFAVYRQLWQAWLGLLLVQVQKGLGLLLPRLQCWLPRLHLWHALSLWQLWRKSLGVLLADWCLGQMCSGGAEGNVLLHQGQERMHWRVSVSWVRGLLLVLYWRWLGLLLTSTRPHHQEWALSLNSQVWKLWSELHLVLHNIQRQLGLLWRDHSWRVCVFPAAPRQTTK